MDNIKPKEPNGLELDKWIRKVEEEIAYEMTELNMLITPLKEAEIKYNEVKKKYAEKLEVIERDKEFKDMLVRKREGYRSNKQIRQLTVTSATTNESNKVRTNRKKNEQSHWKDWTVETLKKFDRFMTPHDLFEIIVHAYTDNFQNKRQISKNRWSYINILLPGFHKTSITEGQPREGSGRKDSTKGVIVRYDAGETRAPKYGLVEWVDKDFKPRPHYIKEFMYDDKVEEVRKIS